MSNDTLGGLDSRLKAAGHDTWGWVIYRCTNSSDNDWATLMDRLKTMSRLQMLDYYAATEAMLDQQIWIVIDDRERLENATKSDVRRMFNDWVHSPEAAAEQPNVKSPPSLTYWPRYRFCMHVDETSLRSVLDDSKDWHVNIINRDWVPEVKESDDDDDDENEVCEPEIWPEIEGCTEEKEDVGWCKAAQDILVGRYVDLCKQNFWYAFYTRPHREPVEQDRNFCEDSTFMLWYVLQVDTFLDIQSRTSSRTGSFRCNEELDYTRKLCLYFDHHPSIWNFASVVESLNPRFSTECAL